VKWSDKQNITDKVYSGEDFPFTSGIYDVLVDNWELEPDRIMGKGRVGNIPEYTQNSFNVGSYCKDESTWNWDPDDATHLI